MAAETLPARGEQCRVLKPSEGSCLVTQNETLSTCSRTLQQLVLETDREKMLYSIFLRFLSSGHSRYKQWPPLSDIFTRAGLGYSKSVGGVLFLTRAPCRRMLPLWRWPS